MIIKPPNLVRVKTSRELEKKIQDLYLDMAKQINYQKQQLPKGSLQYQRLRGLQGEILASLRRSGSLTDEMIQQGVKDVSQDVLDASAEFIENFGFYRKTGMGSLNEQVIKNTLNGAMYGKEGYWTLSKSIWKDVAQTQKDIDFIIAESIGMNKSVQEIASILEQYIDPTATKDWDWGKVYPGTKKKVDYNAQRLARTLLTHAYQDSVVQSAKVNPWISKVRWDVSNSGRVCDLCLDREGKLYDPDKVPYDHPNGMCILTYIFDSDMKDIADELADWVLDPDSANPAINDYMDIMGFEDRPMTITKPPEPLSRLQELLGEIPNSVGLVNSSWEDQLSSAEKDAIRAYTGQGYRDINPALREHSFKYLEDYRISQIGDISSALQKYTVEEDFYVTRVFDEEALSTMMKLSPDELKGLSGQNPGTIFRDFGFVSTAADNSEENFSKNEVNTIIKVPKGTRGAYISNFSMFPEENEFLLDRGQAFRVDSLEYVNGKFELIMEVIP